MIITDNMLDTLRLHLPGSLDGVIKLELFNAIDEFCRTSDAYREVLQVPLQEGVTSYILTMPEHMLLARVISVSHQTMGLGWTVYDPASDMLLLSNTPNAEHVETPLYVVVSLTPAQDGLQDLDDWLPADVWRNNYQAFLDGALGKMLGQYAKPYSSKDLAVYHLHRFRNAIAVARNEANTGPIKGAQNWMYPFNRTCGVPVAVAPIFVGPKGPPGGMLEGDIGVEVETRIEMTGLYFPSFIQHVTTLGFSVMGDHGGADWVRTANPSYPGAARSLDRFKPDGTTDNVTGGWWRMINTELDMRAFGLVADFLNPIIAQNNVVHLREAFAYFDLFPGGVLNCEERYELDIEKLANDTPGAGNVQFIGPSVPGDFTLTTSAPDQYGFKITGAGALDPELQNHTVLRIEAKSNVKIKLGFWGSGTASGTGEIPGAIYIYQPDNASAPMRNIEIEAYMENFKLNWWIKVENHSWDGNVSNRANSGFPILDLRFINCKAISYAGNASLPTQLGPTSHVILIQGMMESVGGYVENVTIENFDFECTHIRGGIVIWQGVRNVRIRDGIIRNAGQGPAFTPNSMVDRTAIRAYSSMQPWLSALGQTGWNREIYIENVILASPAECGVYTATCGSMTLTNVYVYGQTSTTESDAFGQLPRAGLAISGCQFARIIQPRVESCYHGIFWNAFDNTLLSQCSIIAPRVTNIRTGGYGIRLDASHAGGYVGAVTISDAYVQGSATDCVGLVVFSAGDTIGFQTLAIDNSYFAANLYDIQFYGAGTTHPHNNTVIRASRMNGLKHGLSCTHARGNLSFLDCTNSMQNRTNDAIGWDIRDSRFQRLIGNGTFARAAPATGAAWQTDLATAQICSRTVFANVDAGLRVAAGSSRLGIDPPVPGAFTGELEYMELFTPTFAGGQVTYGYQYLSGAFRTLKTAA